MASSRRYAPKSTTRCRRLDMQPDTNIGCLLGRLSMIGVAFVYPRINRLEMPGTEPELLRSGETTPIMLSVDEVRYMPCIPLPNNLQNLIKSHL